MRIVGDVGDAEFRQFFPNLRAARAAFGLMRGLQHSCLLSLRFVW